MYRCFPCMYVCTPLACLVPAEARRGCQMSQKERYRLLSAVMQVLLTVKSSLQRLHSIYFLHSYPCISSILVPLPKDKPRETKEPLLFLGTLPLGWAVSLVYPETWGPCPAQQEGNSLHILDQLAGFLWLWSYGECFLRTPGELTLYVFLLRAFAQQDYYFTCIQRELLMLATLICYENSQGPDATFRNARGQASHCASL